MQDTRAQRWLGLAGLLFVVLLAVAIALVPMISAHSSAAKVISNVHNHKSAFNISAIVTGLAVVEGLFFFFYLREFLCDVAANRRLATVGYAGVILFATSGGISAGIQFMMTDAVGHASPAVLQMLNVMQNDFTFVMGAAGTMVFLFASGIAIIRNGPLHKWIGWLAVVLGVLAAVGGVAPAGLWVLVVSIGILIRARRGASAPASTPTS